MPYLAHTLFAPPGPPALAAASPAIRQAERPQRQAYVIEVGETQAGLVARRDDERFFTFISASAAFDSLDGRRFATPVAAERAARHILAPHRGRSGRPASP
jgi:hypothetical protein